MATAMAFDNAGGRIQLKTSAMDTDGKPDIVWHGAEAEDIFDKMNSELREHARSLSSRFVQNPTWATLGFKHLIRAHPLGGCPIGQGSSACGQSALHDLGTRGAHCGATDPGDWRMIRIPCFEPGQNPARC
jgi:hypothetical protein